ncbi:MAG TPA: GntR family transcriptional regulator [Armatimonadota bacterium]|nr:GntR family transcriptional regulator [Armatimonadota bacterium]
MRTKYELIRQEIISALQRGEWKPGEQLPPLPELAKQFQASRWATERALHLLINEGLLGRQPKKGTFVRHAAMEELFEHATLAVVGVGPDKWMEGDYLGPLMGNFAAELGDRDWVFLQYSRLQRAAEQLRLLGAALVVAVNPNRSHVVMLEELASKGFHILCLGARVNEPRLHSIAVDNMQGVISGLRHLVQQGHRRVAFIGANTDSYDTIDRVEGFRIGVKTLGLDQDPSLLICQDHPKGIQAFVEETLDTLFSRPTPPDAIFSGGFTLTGHILEAFARRGITYPNDVSLIAFDDSSLFSHLATPLTVIKQPLAEVGKRAARVLPLLADNIRQPIRLVLPAELLVRGSCHPTKVRV